jgi:RecA/RadA recombinase
MKEKPPRMSGDAWREQRVREILEEAEIALEETPKASTVSTGDALLDGLTGGIPLGRITQIFGDWETSTAQVRLCMQILANAQKKETDVVVFVDADRSLSRAEMPRVLEPQNFLIVRPSTTEETLQMLTLLCQRFEVSAIAVHSIAGLLPAVEAASSLSEDLRGAHRAALIPFLKGIEEAAQRNKTAVVLTDQERYRLNWRGCSTSTTGGNAAARASSLRLYMEVVSAPLGGASLRTRVTVLRSTTAAPYQACEITWRPV